MIGLLSRWFIRDRDNVTDPRVRRAYGQLCGLVGIGLNLLLFAGKLFAGAVSGSVAITADAFNNLSDAGSSVVTLLGFRLAGKKPDPHHPFGHGRLEYVSGLIVAGLILLMGVELAKTSVEKILHPSAVDFSVAALVILVFSTVTTTFLDAWSAGISAESLSGKLSGKTVAIVTTLVGVAGAILFPMDDITNFLYLIGSVFAPMIAVQIADHFLLRRDRFAVAADARNLVIWLMGFVAYRLLMGVDTPVGYTLPDMVLTILLCVIAEKLKPSAKQ